MLLESNWEGYANFSSLFIVPLPEQVDVRSRCPELSKAGQAHSVLILQERLPVCHRGEFNLGKQHF